jgi:alanine-glyoxylate transaminase/serine-glyoxylate transaminase/serine-pyruvate transaminase
VSRVIISGDDVMVDNYFGERTILMIPGPTELHPAVREVLSKPIVAHYGGAWKTEYEETVKLSAGIFKTKAEVFIMPTPGTVALETGVLSLIEPGEEVVVLDNGFFSGRLAEIAENAGAIVTRLAAEPGDYVKPEKLREMLDTRKGVKAVLMVQNETSTGVFNPIPAYARIAGEKGVLTIVDAISSYGGAEMDFDGWGLDYCVGYANKCLGSIPGAVPVAVSERAWEAFRRRKTKPRSFFTNLGVWRYYMDEWKDIGHPYPTTVNPYAYLGLKVAAKAALDEGLETRYRRHIVVAAAFRKAVRAMGLEMLPPEDIASPLVTAISLPTQIWRDSGKINKIMLEKYGIMIGGGIASLHGKIIRIGHMCLTASSRYILPTLAALESTFRELGLPVKDGKEVFTSELSRLRGNG